MHVAVPQITFLRSGCISYGLGLDIEPNEFGLIIKMSNKIGICNCWEDEMMRSFWLHLICGLLCSFCKDMMIFKIHWFCKCNGKVVLLCATQLLLQWGSNLLLIVCTLQKCIRRGASGLFLHPSQHNIAANQCGSHASHSSYSDGAIPGHHQQLKVG